jgi:hypothetical protein
VRSCTDYYSSIERAPRPNSGTRCTSNARCQEKLSRFWTRIFSARLHVQPPPRPEPSLCMYCGSRFLKHELKEGDSCETFLGLVPAAAASAGSSRCRCVTDCCGFNGRSTFQIECALCAHHAKSHPSLLQYLFIITGRSVTQVAKEEARFIGSIVCLAVFGSRLSLLPCDCPLQP